MDDGQAEIPSVAERVLASDVADLSAGERTMVLEMLALHQKSDRDQIARADSAGSMSGG